MATLLTACARRRASRVLTSLAAAAAFWACTESDSTPNFYAGAAASAAAALEANGQVAAAGTASAQSATSDSGPQDPNAGDANAPPPCYAPKDDNDFFGAARCCHTNAALCEDFEGEAVGGEPNARLWRVLSSGEAYTAKVSAGQAARGSQSLHLMAANGSGQQQAMIVNSSAFPFPNNVFWGRAFVFWASPTRPNNHVSYVAAGPSPNANYQWLRFSSFGGGQLGGNDSDPDNSSGSTTTLASGGWTCLEWHFDPTPNVMRATYYADGKEISQLAIDPKHAGTGDLDFAQVELGWEIYTKDGSGAGWELYLDEVALDGERIGCAN